jgi:hypothetical protein
MSTYNNNNSDPIFSATCDLLFFVSLHKPPGFHLALCPVELVMFHATNQIHQTNRFGIVRSELREYIQRAAVDDLCNNFNYKGEFMTTCARPCFMS